jgi:hypothetical protein
MKFSAFGTTLIEGAAMWAVVARAVLGGFADGKDEIGADLSRIATTFNLR